MITQVKLTHLAFHVANLDKSIEFYTKFTSMRTIRERFDGETQMRVAWLSDRPAGKETEFVIVLLEGQPTLLTTEKVQPQAPLGPISHLGFAMETREEVDKIAELGKQNGILSFGPAYVNEVVAYICILADPDGHQVEFSYGQVLG